MKKIVDRTCCANDPPAVGRLGATVRIEVTCVEHLRSYIEEVVKHGSEALVLSVGDLTVKFG